MKNLILIIITLVSFQTGLSQKNIEATSQKWHGGICCRTGINYSVSFEMDKIAETMILDKIYLKGTGEIAGTISYTDKVTGERVYTVSFGTYSDRSGEIETIQTDNSPAFNGTALILATIDDKPIRIEIKEFKELNPIAYP